MGVVIDRHIVVSLVFMIIEFRNCDSLDISVSKTKLFDSDKLKIFLTLLRAVDS